MVLKSFIERYGQHKLAGLVHSSPSSQLFSFSADLSKAQITRQTSGIPTALSARRCFMSPMRTKCKFSLSSSTLANPEAWIAPTNAWKSGKCRKMGNGDPPVNSARATQQSSAPWAWVSLYQVIPLPFRCRIRISIKGYVGPLVRWSVSPLVHLLVHNSFVKVAKSDGKSSF